MDRSVSPDSCVSMKSDSSMFEPAHFSTEPLDTKTKSEKDRSVSPVPSCVSMNSDSSMFEPAHFSTGQADMKPQSEKDRSVSPVPSCVSMKSDSSMFEPAHFSTGQADMKPQVSISAAGELVNTTEPVDDKQMDNQGLSRVVKNHKANLKSRFENISEGISKPGAKVFLNEIYTEIYITVGDSEEVNKEHEVWQIEAASKAKTTEDTPINCNDIFKSLHGQKKHIRTVMTKDVAGIGKTVSVQKFILDWTDGIANQDVEFIFLLSFRELNLVRNDQYSLHKLLLDFHPTIEELKDREAYKNCRVIFIFDGLDESRFSLNFQSDIVVCDVKETSSVDVLLKSLILGNLLPSALIWITSRPAAASQIPAHYINQVTEIRGFRDPQKEEYFRKRISDESQASRFISHIKSTRSLHIMCHIPVFCWISATVLQEMLEQHTTKEIPKTLTEMFIHFLLTHITRQSQKYKGAKETDSKRLLKSQKEIILGLAKLAFRNLQNGKQMFYDEDLRECGIDVGEVSVFSDLCTEIFKKESLFNQKKVYYFVHLTLQEFLAALHIFVSYSIDMENMGEFFSLEESLKLAATKALENKNGHLDLFVRFLMGISLESNQRLLQDLLNKIHNTSKSIEKACRYIKELNRQDLSPERYINLLHCLFEMKDHSLHKKVQTFLSSNNFKQKLSPAQCSALAHMLLMSEEVLDELDLKKYNTSDEGCRRLIPAVRCCRKATLDRCKLNQMSWETIKRSLLSTNSLIHLNLSSNVLEDSGIQILSAGLTSPHCKLQILMLCDCKLSAKSCEIVASVLQSPNSLIELDLSHNDLGDSGVKHLSQGLESSDSKLQILRLSGCLISKEGCRCLAAALTSNPSHLKELDLSYNHPGESGLKLSVSLEDAQCELETLNLDHCAEIRLRSGGQKYTCALTLDPNTTGRPLSLTEENRKVTFQRESESQSLHLAYDNHHKVLCREGLSGRCYWEAEWSGEGAHIAVVYKRIDKKGRLEAGMLGCNGKSWSLMCSDDSYSAKHNNVCNQIPYPGSRRVGVYLDWLAGILSFYSVSSDKLTHLYTFHSTFTEPLYPGFGVWTDSSVSLCQIT